MINRIICFFLVLTSILAYDFSFYKTSKTNVTPISYEKVEKDMSKYCGIESYVKNYNGVPTLFVNGNPYPSAAYMTYLQEYGRFDQFADAGYKLFSIPVLFAGRWISATSGLTPFSKGIFDEKGKADYSVLDESVRNILSVCPDALILPRVNICMPQWWIDENKDLLDGTGIRESLYSEKWLKDTENNLRQFISYVIQSDYADHIVGYQIAGGNTEEWFHFDLNGGISQAAEAGFCEFLNKYYPETEYKGLPDLSKLDKKSNRHRDDYLAKFLEYASFAVADDIAYLAHAAKEESGGNVVVGTFYGYSLEVTSSLHGTHALSQLLKSDDIDFICSPNSYIGTRNPDADWTEMYPADSIRLHGKLCVQECDIRTYLTKTLNECAPEYDPGNIMNAPIWHGLADRNISVQMIRKSFCRQLIKGNGFWWFDMWGGWYDDEIIMTEMENMRNIYQSSLDNPQRESIAQLAVFVDESAYKDLTYGKLRNAPFNQREALGYIGTVYDLYDISDFEAVYDRYKAVVFITGIKTDGLKAAVSICRKSKTPYILNSDLKPTFSVKELKSFCRANGIHIYCDSEDIVYINNDYIAVHACTQGKKTLLFDEKVKLAEILDGKTELEGETVEFEMNYGDTKLFKIQKQS